MGHKNARSRTANKHHDKETEVLRKTKIRSGLTERNLMLELIERRGSDLDKEKEIQSQHGPVKILWKDGKPVE